MSGIVLNLPRRTGAFYTVAKDRGAWAVQLVKPGEERKAIAWHTDRRAALVHGAEKAATMGLPFRVGRARL